MFYRWSYPTNMAQDHVSLFPLRKKPPTNSRKSYHLPPASVFPYLVSKHTKRPPKPLQLNWCQQDTSCFYKFHFSFPSGTVCITVIDYIISLFDFCFPDHFECGSSIMPTITPSGLSLANFTCMLLLH